jgi:hypothetical protein
MMQISPNVVEMPTMFVVNQIYLDISGAKLVHLQHVQVFSRTGAKIAKRGSKKKQLDNNERALGISSSDSRALVIHIVPLSGWATGHRAPS